MSAAPDRMPAGPGRHWPASLHLEVEARGGVSRVTRRDQRGPLALQRALYPEGRLAHLYLLHPPGGVVGGDTLDISLRCARDAACLATTPGAAKFYRGNGTPASQRQRVVADGAAVEWLPQENIFFDGAVASLHSKFVVEAGGRLLAWELNTFGRPAAELPFRDGRVSSELRVIRGGNEILRERLVLDPSRGVGTGAAALKGHSSSGMLLALPADQSALEATRAAIGGSACPFGATLMGELLVVRCLGRHHEIRRVLTSAWANLRPLVAGRTAVEPRIWAT